MTKNSTKSSTPIRNNGSPRDPTEITCSVQIALGVDESGSEAADKAAALSNAGCDKVIFTMRGKYNASQVEEVATSLEQLVPE